MYPVQPKKYQSANLSDLQQSASVMLVRGGEGYRAVGANPVPHIPHDCTGVSSACDAASGRLQVLSSDESNCRLQ